MFSSLFHNVQSRTILLPADRFANRSTIAESRSAGFHAQGEQVVGRWYSEMKEVVDHHVIAFYTTNKPFLLTCHETHNYTYTYED